MSKSSTHDQISQLFEKLAWPFEPGQVATALRDRGAGATASDVLRGQKYVDTAKSLGQHAASAAQTAGRGVSRILAPAHAEGRALAGELGQLGTAIRNRPGLMRAGAGGLLLAPIMMGALDSTQQKREDELMNLQMNPSRGFDKLSNSDLDVFLEKKAAAREQMLPVIGNHTFTHFTEGIGKGVGGGIAQAILSTIGGGLHSAYDSLIVDPKRKKLFESVVRTDPVVSDALARNPHAAQTLAEAFQTMVRFAPSLSLDVNAVRSFLREAVVGGASGVNYATIKSLIETEKAHGSMGGGNR
jgi:hypothetical protein